MENLIQNIVKEAESLKDKYTDQKNVPVNYAYIINTRFHNAIEGQIGYMAAYCDAYDIIPQAVSYLTNPSTLEDYYYVTKRPFNYQQYTQALVAIGGPVKKVDEVFQYDQFTDVDQSIQEEISDFVEKTYPKKEEKTFKKSFVWHGLMGYTKSMVRMIGPDPKDKRLLYNIGCNGVGILPSVVGAQRISDYIQKNILIK